MILEYIANDMIPGSGSGGHSAAKIHGIYDLRRRHCEVENPPCLSR
jgi:hypothetical protein